jgi:undecaprenyl-diphosphatase
MAKNKKSYPLFSFVLATFFLAAFMLIVYCISFIDVEPIGPQGSMVGLSGLNMRVFKFFGYNDTFYNITEVLGFIAIAVAGGFALLGLYQLVTRKSLKKSIRRC